MVLVSLQTHPFGSSRPNSPLQNISIPDLSSIPDELLAPTSQAQDANVMEPVDLDVLEELESLAVNDLESSTMEMCHTVQNPWRSAKRVGPEPLQLPLPFVAWSFEGSIHIISSQGLSG